MLAKATCPHRPHKLLLHIYTVLTQLVTRLLPDRHNMLQNLFLSSDREAIRAQAVRLTCNSPRLLKGFLSLTHSLMHSLTHSLKSNSTY